MRDIICVNVNLELLSKLINSAFVGVWITYVLVLAGTNRRVIYVARYLSSYLKSVKKKSEFML